jgi:hypothetical protein
MTYVNFLRVNPTISWLKRVIKRPFGTFISPWLHPGESNVGWLLN